MKEAKNDLESYIYDLRANIDSYGTLEKYIDPSIKDKVLSEVQTAADWIYSATEAGIDDFRNKLQDFKRIGDPVRARFNFYSEIGALAERF